MRDFLTKAKILIVDDFSGFRLTLKSMLSYIEARNIHQASTGLEAIKFCEENTYQIIFCDYNLGDGQDGQQILEELHQRHIIKRGTLFFMVTAETTTAQVMGAIEYRPDTYLTKPFTGEQLQKRINRLVERNIALEKIHQTINKGEITQALEVCDQVMKEKPKFRYSCLRIKSELFIELDDHRSAKAIFDEVIKEHPLLWAMIGVAKLYFDQGNYHKSKNYFVEIRNMHPRQVNVYDWIAKCEGALGEIEKAEHTLLEAVKISPKSLCRQLSLGKVASKLKHHDIAQEAFSNSLHEGNNSCLLKPRHFQYYYDSTRKAVKQLKGMEKTYVMARADSVVKNMERKYKEKPHMMATNFSSVAKLYAEDGQSDKASFMLSKLSSALNEGGHHLNKREAEDINKNLEGIVDHSRHGHLASISGKMRQINDIIEQQPDMPEPAEEPLIETLQPVSFFVVTDQKQVAKKVNEEGLKLVEQKEQQLALEKFREAIKISPENASYYLNAASIILISPKLNKVSELIDEAREYLKKSNTRDDDSLRQRRYESLMEKLSNV